MRVLKGADRDAELVRAERREQEWKAKARVRNDPGLEEERDT
jgi:hypothetical protein